MKRTLFVMALAAMLVLGFAATAFAYVPNPTYIAWDGTGANVNGPHADYQTATTKCAVCHSVHAAPGASFEGTTGGVPWTAGTSTELLLRSTAAESCKYCHIDTAVGGVQLYGGASGVYGTWMGPGHSGLNHSACTNCHAVHGANTYKGANISKIIRLTPSVFGPSSPQSEIIGGSGATAGLYDTQAHATASTLKYEQQSVFCSSCHPNFSRSADVTITATQRRSHSMVSAPSTAFSATNGGPATQYGENDVVVSSSVTHNSGVTISAVEVASAGSGSCRACHIAGGVDQSGVSWNSFPHYTRGYPYFLSEGATGGSVNGTIGNTGAPIETAADGNCLLCHGAVGTTF
ncbi:MAG: hypothetical protein LLG08_03140 [Actinomycetia bacterium]|nr:hypothetical protein [Actinomycetes bacterium]